MKQGVLLVCLVAVATSCLLENVLTEELSSRRHQTTRTPSKSWSQPLTTSPSPSSESHEHQPTSQPEHHIRQSSLKTVELVKGLTKLFDTEDDKKKPEPQSPIKPEVIVLQQPQQNILKQTPLYLNPQELIFTGQQQFPQYFTAQQKSPVFFTQKSQTFFTPQEQSPVFLAPQHSTFFTPQEQSPVFLAPQHSTFFPPQKQSPVLIVPQQPTFFTPQQESPVFLMSPKGSAMFANAPQEQAVLLAPQEMGVAQPGVQTVMVTAKQVMKGPVVVAPSQLVMVQGVVSRLVPWVAGGPLIGGSTPAPGSGLVQPVITPVVQQENPLPAQEDSRSLDNCQPCSTQEQLRHSAHHYHPHYQPYSQYHQLHQDHHLLHTY